MANDTWKWFSLYSFSDSQKEADLDINTFPIILEQPVDSASQGQLHLPINKIKLPKCQKEGNYYIAL